MHVHTTLVTVCHCYNMGSGYGLHGCNFPLTFHLPCLPGCKLRFSFIWNISRIFCLVTVHLTEISNGGMASSMRHSLICIWSRHHPWMYTSGLGLTGFPWNFPYCLHSKACGSCVVPGLPVASDSEAHLHGMSPFRC